MAGSGIVNVAAAPTSQAHDGPGNALPQTATGSGHASASATSASTVPQSPTHTSLPVKHPGAPSPPAASASSAASPAKAAAAAPALTAAALLQLVSEAEEELVDVLASAADIEPEDPNDPAAIEFVQKACSVTLDPAAMRALAAELEAR